MPAFFLDAGLGDAFDALGALALRWDSAFAAWPFQSGHTPWEGKVSKPTDIEYLKVAFLIYCVARGDVTARHAGQVFGALE